jgi:hypothetical protein
MPGLERHETISRGASVSVVHPTNLPASVKQRLLNLSQQSNVEFNVILTKYALERLLYRISVSRLRDRFILKGALLFWVWKQMLHRTTRDADFLDLESTSLERLNLEFREICALNIEDDGVRFLPESVQRDIRATNNRTSPPSSRRTIARIFIRFDEKDSMEEFSYSEECLGLRDKIRAGRSRRSQISYAAGKRIGQGDGFR